MAARFGVVIFAACIAACTHTPAPLYQPSVENTGLLLDGQSNIRVGSFDAAPSAENEVLTARGASMSGGTDGLYSTYLRDALAAELKTAGRLDPSSATTVGGTLVRNELNAGGINTADAAVAARFVVQQQGETVYEKTLTAEHEWESSFMGMIAVPAAVQNYVATVQKLLGKLFADPAFAQATSGEAGTAGK